MYKAFNSNLVRVACWIIAAARALGYGVFGELAKCFAERATTAGLVHLHGVRPAGEWNLLARFCRSVNASGGGAGGIHERRRSARISRRADLKISGQNDYLVGATISGDVTIQFVILIVPMYSFPVSEWEMH